MKRGGRGSIWPQAFFAFACLLAFQTFTGQGGFSVEFAEQSETAVRGWMGPALKDGGFLPASLPAYGGGYYRVGISADSPRIQLRVQAGGVLRNLYIDGVRVWSHNTSSERNVYSPRRYDFNVGLGRPGSHLLAADVDGGGFFTVGAAPHPLAIPTLLILAASASCVFLPAQRMRFLAWLAPEPKRVAAFLAALSFVFFISSGYITQSNDGSHFALVSALAENRSVKINDYARYTWGVDYNLKDGDYYSDRPPGTAFLAMPFYLVGKALRGLGLASLISPAENVTEVFVMFLPNVAGAAAAGFLYLLLRHFRFGPAASLATAAAFAFGSLCYLEATHLQSHVVAMALTGLSAYLAVAAKEFTPGRTIALSLALAFSSIVEIQNIVFVPLFAGYLAWSGKAKRGGSRHYAAAALAFVLVYSALIAYNWAAFHELTIKSNRWNPAFPEESSFAKSLSGNPFVGAWTLFFGNLSSVLDWAKGTQNDAPGLLVLSPIFLAALWHWPRFLREHFREGALFAAVVAAETAAVAFHATVLTRHILPVTPLIFLPAAYAAERALKDLKSGRWVVPALLGALFLASAARVFYVTNTYWSRTLENPFPYAEELPSYVLMAAIAWVLYAAARGVGRRG
jgi:hypothetical protein